ncbi:AraC family transcriptional regulator [Ruegeria sp. HKCCD7255]|uniref:helix-turn-helix transcriptional regulator n=1 Tax=Ruegeria sp. HKCCD7255 TaxID=2683004 RepID=UPI001487CC89|nr:AraC family transcriptional regulator [Ruegeria sp. HKCCD7255]
MNCLEPDLNISILPEKARRDAWDDFMADFWRLGRPLVSRRNLELSVSSRQLEGAVFCQLAMSPAELVGNNHEFDCVVIRYQNEGHTVARVNGETTRVAPGSLTVMDLSATRYCYCERSKVTYLAFRKSALQVTRYPLRPMTHFDSKTSVGRLMIANFLHLANEISHKSETCDASAINLFASLLVAAITDREELNSEDVHIERAKRIRAEQYIFSRPLSLPLSIDEMCVAVGMSRSTLYRLFRADGGLQAYLTNLRLEYARDTLASSQPTRGAVTSVATRLGFLDTSSFVRSFRRRYDCKPSDVLGSEYNKPGEVDAYHNSIHLHRTLTNEKPNKGFFENLGALAKTSGTFHITPTPGQSAF